MTHRYPVLTLALLVCSLIQAPSANAQNGTWNANAAGNWSDSANWLGGIIADGTDNTATFSDVITLDRIVTLDSDRTIGNITALDTSHNYTIAGTNILTLGVSSGSPIINVAPAARTLFISSPIVTTSGLQKKRPWHSDPQRRKHHYRRPDDQRWHSDLRNAAALGAPSKNVTFTGTGALNYATGASFGQLSVGTGITATLTGAVVGNFTSATGSGTIVASTGTGTINLNDASAFTGNLRHTITGNTTTVSFTRLADAVSLGSGNLQFGGNSSDSNQGDRYTLTGNEGPLTFNNRQVELINNTAQNAIRVAILANNQTNGGNNAWVINTNLINGVTTRNVEFQLEGTNTGNNAFNGLIADNPTPTRTLSFIKDGAGRWLLGNAANTYTGTTTIRAGTLEVTSLADGGSNSSIGASSNAANNLVFGFGSSNTANLSYVGTGSSTDRAFSFNGNVANIGWTFTASGTGAVNFTNTASPVFGTADQTRTLTLAGTNTDANTLAATLVNNGTGAFSLVKNGPGRWVLSGTNTYTGTTTINAGALQAIDGIGLPTDSILQLRGGVFQSSGTFTRNVSTAAGAVNWATSSGGFAAADAPLILNLNGGTGSLTWNGSSFVSTGQALIFGSTSANDLVDFQNGINLGSSGTNTRTITVIDNVNSSTDRARISGVISNTFAGQSLLKNGTGILELTNANTYSGFTTVDSGTLVVNGTHFGGGNYTVNATGTLAGSGTIGSLVNVAAKR